MSDDIIDHFFIAPASSHTLDTMAGLFAIVRGANETDAQLRTRISGLLRHQPGPDRPTMMLFILLEKLGLNSTTAILDIFCPVGVSRR